MSVVIIDFQSGNLFSVVHALKMLELDVVVSSDPKDLENASAAVLPGVGSFGAAMDNLHASGMVEPLKQYIFTGKPFMGICLGLQLLFSQSEESPAARGLDLISGKVIKFNAGAGVKVPHVGWSPLIKGNKSWSNSFLKHISEQDYLYFVHSYFVKPDNDSDILAMAEYEGILFCSAIMKKNIFATQFHPEKSGNAGMKILKDFAAAVRNGK